MDQNLLESKEDLQRRMRETRQSMAQTMGEIRHEFSEAFNWKAYIQRYPGACLLVAAGFGLAVGNCLAGFEGQNLPTSDFVKRPERTPSTYITRAADAIASLIFAQAIRLLTEKMKDAKASH